MIIGTSRARFVRRWSAGLVFARPLAVGALASLMVSCSSTADEVATNVGGADAALARTAEILTSSTRQKPGVLRVLFYGQSISSPAWTDLTADHLRKQFPNTAIVSKNLAIGGNSATYLERATERDVEDFYPDLIVFHVFGDHRAYERIIRLFRSRTAAEVIVQTDPVRVPIEPVCPEGLNLSGKTPRGCSGSYWLKQRVWEDFMSGSFIPRMAAKYRLALDPRRTGWNLYLLRHGLAPDDLLADGLHPNSKGWKLAAVLFNTYFDTAIRRWRGQRQKIVQALHAPEAETTTYEIDGNRVELISDRPFAESLYAQIDGQPTRAIDGCWQTSRVSPVPGIPEWPAIRQVYVDRTTHKATTWLARVHGQDFAASDFTFSIDNDRLGYDGDGRGSDDFYSKNGEVRILKEDWALPYAERTTKLNHLPDNFRLSWTLRFKCNQQARVLLPNGKYEYRYLVASGLPNGRHVLMMTIQDRDRIGINEVRVYRPPLVD